MMDSKCITSIVNFVKQTDFVESCLLNVEVRPIECGIDEEGKASHCVHMILSDSFGRKAQLSEAWVASNLLLFSVFDGYLENKYALMEGASFKIILTIFQKETALIKYVRIVIEYLK